MTIEANELRIPEDAMRRLAEMRPGQHGRDRAQLLQKRPD